MQGLGGRSGGGNSQTGGGGGMDGMGGSGSGMEGDCGGNSLPGGVGGMEQESADCNGAGGVGEYPGESDAERQARLEGTLEESVGDFDEVLAEEQREISTVGRNTEGYGGGEGGSGGGVGLGSQGGGGSSDGGGGGGGGGSSASTSAQNQAGSSPSIAGMSEEERNSRTPEDIPDLVSEDIVAKQLREAALSEEDPALRERLWEEYRTYNKL
jgi:hypothetical protein